MKITLTLPESLVRRVKARAARAGTTADAVVADLLVRGLDATETEPRGLRLDVMKYLGRWSHYETVNEILYMVRELRKDRDGD